MYARYARSFAVFLGVASLGYFLYRFGAANTWHDLKKIGWRLSVLVALEALVHLISARAWWYMFPSTTRQGRFCRIWMVQLAGNAINDTSPGAPLAGEPIKAILLNEQFDLPVTTATLLSAKLAQALARALFIVLGVAAVSRSLRFEGRPAVILGAGFVLTTSGIATFMVLQIRGLSASVRRILHRLRLPQGRVERFSRALERVDEYLYELYRGRPQDFVASVALVLAGLFIGVVEVWLMLGWLGLSRDWLSSLAIESFTVLVSFAFFVIPASLGAQEGGKLLIFAALGLPLSAGLSLGVAFRLNSLVSLGVGFTALMLLRREAFQTR
jgi:uncharacterized protein (TIRG00374 family)